MGEWENTPYYFVSEGERTRRLRSCRRRRRVLPELPPPEWVAVDRDLAAT
ncbi:uncharacterized protein G2W53_035133 [Senna tora]|uniref:Uncharacterized protein n=1 Tax=Senna tora TaxID=362788 RepID=A0A834SPQ8_9FABA|nr:uncharacterized protein G2W53_035133 [Senna tora]